MELRLLPLDGFRAISEYLSFRALITLNATLDRNIQRLVCAPGIVDTIIIARESGIDGSLRYFLNSVKNVRQVLFKIDIQWSLQRFSALRILNPLELTLRGSLVSNQAIQTFNAHLDPANATGDAESADLCRNLSRGYLPNFQRLTPRLTTLTLKESLEEIVGINRYETPVPKELFLFPSTLTSLHLNSRSGDVALLGALPATLRTLAAQHVPETDWNTVLASVPNLEHLRIRDLHIKSTYKLILPTSLTSVSFNPVLRQTADILLDFLRDTQLTSIDMLIKGNSKSHNSPHYTHDFIERGALPSTLSHLSLIHRNLYSLSAALPHLLVSLTTELVSEKGWMNLALLPHLQTLILKKHPLFKQRFKLDDAGSAWDDSQVSLLSTSVLPPSLTHLELPTIVRTVTEAAVTTLPRNLVFLSLSSLSLALLPLLRERAPKCRLNMVKSVALTQSANVSALDATLFPKLWAPTMDVSRWIRGVYDYYCSLGAIFDVSDGHTVRAPYAESPGTKTLIIADNALNADDNGPFAALRNLRSITTALTQLTMLIATPSAGTNFELVLSCLPATITHLELADAHVYWNANLPNLQYLSMGNADTTHRSVTISPQQDVSKFRHIDAPRLCIPAKDVSSWQWTGMSKLHATLLDMDDFNVLDFLTQTVDAVTRSNMAVTLIYNVTGVLLPESGPEAVTIVDMDLIQERTEAMLSSKLSEPMLSHHSLPVASPSHADDNGTAPVVDTIGSVLVSIQPSGEKKTQIVLPNSATEATIRLPYGGWCLTERRLNSNTLRDPLALPPGLVRLELVGVVRPSLWWHLLPSTLRYLRVASDSPLAEFGAYMFPPNLETLSLEASTGLRGSGDRLPFSLSDLPSSLERLALVAPWIKLTAEDEKSETGVPHLKRLQWIFVSEVYCEAAHRLHQLVEGRTKPDPKIVVERLLSVLLRWHSTGDFEEQHPLLVVAPRPYGIDYLHPAHARILECPLRSDP